MIYIEMSMQGATGPARDHLGFGATISALCGLHHLTGWPDRTPTGTGTNFPDHVPNPCHAAFALLAALRHRRATGEGQYIDLAQTEPTLAMLGPALLDAAMNGRDAGAAGNRLADAAPHGVYPCAGEDRWIAIAVLEDRQWQALARVLGLGDEADPCWSVRAGRLASQDALDARIAAATRDRDADALMSILQAAGVPAGAVRDARAVVVDDPQLAHRGHWVRLDHPVMGASLYNAPPFRIDGFPVRLRRRAPLLGEDTEAVCAEVLGLDARTIARLRADGAFR